MQTTAESIAAHRDRLQAAADGWGDEGQPGEPLHPRWWLENEGGDPRRARWVEELRRVGVETWRTQQQKL